MERVADGGPMVAAALATALGWRFVGAANARTDAGSAADSRVNGLDDQGGGQWVAAHHTELVRAADRRESLVVAGPLLASDQRAALVGALRNVRFTRVAAAEGTPHGSRVNNECDAPASTDDAVFTVHADASSDVTVARIRREFGV